MKGNNNAPNIWAIVGREEFRRPGANGPVELQFFARENLQTGDSRVEIQIPNARLSDLPKDLSVLLQCFGWGMASLGMRMNAFPPAAWHDCCRVVWKVEDLFP
jgi:hypothetical protein